MPNPDLHVAGDLMPAAQLKAWESDRGCSHSPSTMLARMLRMPRRAA